MTTTQISPEKLAEFDALVLNSGSHSKFESGHCAMEVVSWLADEGFTDAPTCASRIVRRYTIALNDRWDDERRQQLKPYLLRMIDTGSDGKEAIRERIATKHALGILPDLLRLAGMEDQIAALDAIEPGNWNQMRKTLWAIRDAAWAKRSATYAELRAKVRAEVEAEMKRRGKPDAAADAAAVAVAAADAAAVAAAAAAAATAAVAVANAVANAVAGADFSYGTAAYWKVREAARKVYDESPKLQPLRELAAQAEAGALELLDRLIDANEDEN